MISGYVNISLFLISDNPEADFQTKHYRRTYIDYSVADRLFDGLISNINEIQEGIDVES